MENEIAHNRQEQKVPALLYTAVVRRAAVIVWRH